MFRAFLITFIAFLTFACDGKGEPPSATVIPTATQPAAPARPDEKKTTGFDGQRAFDHVKTQVDFGPRPAGSPALEKTRQYLLSELQSYGLKPQIDEFVAVTPRGKVKMKNIVAELPGDLSSTGESGVILIASHYDTKLYKEFKFVGANDGGSSTGALLEIARVMTAEKQKRRFTYRFVFFDGEEAFCAEWSECLNGLDHTYGSRHLAEQMQKQGQLSRVKALILLDMIGDKDLTIPRDDTSSPWLIEAIWGTAQALGYVKQFPNRPSSIGDDDHMPFKRLGVPAVDIIDFEFGRGDEDNRFWHTAEDTIDKISPESLKIVGNVLLLSLPKIEAQIR